MPYRGFQQLLDDLPMAAYSCDPSGLITYFNKQASELWGREPKLGDPADRYCGSWQLRSADGTPIDHADCWMALALRTGCTYMGEEIIIERPNGERRIGLAHATPIRDDQGSIVGAVNVLVDVTDRRRMEQALAENEERLRAVIETAVDGILTLDDNGVVLSMNPAAVSLFGYEPHEVIGRAVDILMPEPSKEHHGESLSQFLKTRNQKILGVGLEVTGWRKNGSTLPLHLAISETTLPTGNIFTAIVRDISERVEAEQALRDADRRKDEFLATLAHELRNPLTPLWTELEVSRLSDFDPLTVAQSHGIMERQVAHLSRLVDDILDVSRIMHGKLMLNRERFELAEVLRAVVDEVQGAVDEAGQILEAHIPKEQILVDADRVRLSQIFLNLLNNATKYSPRGGRIEFSLEHLEDAISVSVRDNGLGIPPNKLESVFEMFTQVDRSLETGYRGLGIGLNLVKRLVEMHGGSVEALSRGPGEGSEFKLWLPIVVRDEQQAARASSSDAPSGAPETPRLRVLLAEDNRDVARAISRLVKLLGHEIRVVFNGQDVLDAAAEFQPDIVLMDIGLPKLNGYDAARALRAQSWAKGMILVAVTGWGQESDKCRSRDAGFDEHFTKPLEPDTLRQLLSRSASRTEDRS